MPYFTTSSGKIELMIKLSDADLCSVGGRDAEPYVLELLQESYIENQLIKLDPQTVKEELAEYGAWDDQELNNHERNITRLIWIACGDVSEQSHETLENLRIYDNGGKTLDRYTAVFTNRSNRNGLYDALGFSENPFDPLGFGQYTTAMDGLHLGKLTKYENLPENARQYVENNL